MLWLHHRRAEDDGGMAEAIWDSYGRDAIYGSLLDCGLRDLGRGGSGSVSGECTRDQKSARAEDGRAGEPVVDEAAHVWLIAEFVPPVAGDPYSADVLATAPRPGAEYRSPHSAHAEGADADEYPIGQRDQRHQWGHRAGHREGDSGWGTRSP